MKFAIIGPNQGKTGHWGGFFFKDGIAEVPDDAKDAHSLLNRFYGAHPVHNIEQRRDGVLQLKAVEPQAEPTFLPVSDLPPVFTAAPDNDETDAAGGVIKRTAKNK